jgi:cold shock CspA family protein
LYVAKRTGGGPATTPVRQSQAGSRPEQRGTSCSGRIASLVHGQGHGFIRLADRRTVFFHRSDLCEGTRFGDLAVGETLTFELLEDPISGPRALRVQREKPNR